MSAALSVSTLADGMIPETSIVIIDEALAEASIKVTNSDASASLLYVTLHNIPEDSEPLLFVTPAISRVEPGQMQLVRFILRNDVPLRTQRLKRVVFEGIAQQPSQAQPGEARVGVSVRQNLPVILHPKGLAPEREPWKGLQWRVQDGQLHVSNPTPYVVRLAQELRLLPGNQSVQLARSYILPGDELSMAFVGLQTPATQVRLQPATVYGFAVAAYEAPLLQGVP